MGVLDQFTNRPCKVTKIHSLVTCCLPDEAINSEITDSLIFPSVMTTISQVKLSKYFDTEITHLTLCTFHHGKFEIVYHTWLKL